MSTTTSPEPADHPAGSAAPVAPASPSTPAAGLSAAALTGKRRIAFVTWTDAARLPGLLALLRSLALTNQTVCEDFLVLHDELPDDAAARIATFHPRAELRCTGAESAARRASYAKASGDAAGPEAFGVLEAFRVRDYDTVIVLDTAQVARGPLDRLLTLCRGLAAAPYRDDGDGPGTDVLVVQREYLTDAFCARLDAVALEGAYPQERAAAGVLARALDDGFVPLDTRGVFEPAAGQDRHGASGQRADGEGDIALDEDSDAAFRAAFMALSGAAHHDLLVHFGTPHTARTGDVGCARRVAAAHVAAGEYQDAVDLLGSVRIPVDDAWPHEVYGQALMSVSRDAEARAHLRLATASPNWAPPAFARLAQIAWVRGEDSAARELALAGLDADPTHRPSRQMLLRTAAGDGPVGQVGAGEAEPADPREQLAHVAFYMPQQGNAGDKVLPEAVRLTFGPDAGPRRWHSLHAHRLFDPAALERVNARRGLVIGGGGLFLPDTMPNGNSAWQWNVPDDLLRRIDVPIAVYAVGFNVFDGQSYRHERFRSALRLLAEKAAFFGLRNHGSIAQVRRLLPPELHGKVRFQPCPTTVTRHLVPGWTDPERRDETILLNAAYDRAGLRFGHDYGHFLAELASSVRALDKLAEVRCVAHTVEDERIAYDLRREHGVSLPVVPMYDFDSDGIRAAYARTKLVIGMRGHAGMVPFGCGTPIISLISHPKMAYFLADIERPEWGVSVHDRDLSAHLTERATALLTDHAAAVADVHERQDALWRVTQDNAEALRALGF
ncbi:Polysaccharide pyruvyl transferase family protein WcaK [Actinacidiphila yanglinensis]|uniref:Polysaccharide pyruvyl transferase family protein WcaK n=1 Tax=Actinacidiphila yanglinensis TaxID=310779 RepID=A0A1H5Z2L3_9ACTN|nr:polysaccharide pyruvyl transferase family protein [Actinacidiphila yanglinensis]SEG29875.1 Polysaccharide pyruvyl transferase family protein WcaK [Actinacidiphila yanglinensis]